MAYKFTGSKYNPALTVKEIAALVRKELAAEFPKKAGWKFSVRSDYNSIWLRIVKVPEGVAVFNPEFTKWQEDYPQGFQSLDGIPERYSVEVTKAKEKIENMLEAYNFDDSDSMTDYFHCNFYKTVAVDSDADQQAA